MIHNNPSLTLATHTDPFPPLYDDDDDTVALRVVRLLISVYFCYQLYSNCVHAS